MIRYIKYKEVDTEKEKSRLYEEIGRLKVELDWLKKKCDGYGS